jgi:hypothetical protein
MACPETGGIGGKGPHLGGLPDGLGTARATQKTPRPWGEGRASERAIPWGRGKNIALSI